MNNLQILVKYPRTWHLPWSETLASDDKFIKSLNAFSNQRVIVTEKMDGENTTFTQNTIYARSLNGYRGIDRDWCKAFWNTIKINIPEGYRVCGENLFAKHSIKYTNLLTYFMGFSIWDANNQCIDWDSTIKLFSILGITPVNILYDGIWNVKTIQNIWDSNTELSEGYVVRIADKFSYSCFDTHVAKFVRKNHVAKNSIHWRHKLIVKNELLK